MPAAWSDRQPRVVVAAFGHAWLKDQGFGVRVLECLRELPLANEVHLADWTFGTIAAFQKLCDGEYDRAIFLTGMARGRPPGTLHRFAAPSELPSPEEIHGRVGDCVMGLVSVDNLVILGQYYGVLPDDVVLLEVEPADETWGDDLSPPVAELLPSAVELVLAEIHRPIAELRHDA